MTSVITTIGSRFATTAAFLLACCSCTQQQEKVTIAHAFMRPTTIAVAPVLNFSGEFHLDPVKAADLLASELSYVDGIVVLPVNRVMAVLASEGRSQIESPAHALNVAEAVGADAILVAGITEYDAYTPVVGLVLQLYAPAKGNQPRFNPMIAARMSQPFAMSRMTDPLLPSSQLQAVYNAHHENIQAAVRRFAAPRNAENAHLGWHQYLKVQTLYLRFCWHDAIMRLMSQERAKRLLLAGGYDMEMPA